MKGKTVKIPLTDDLETIMICALRYACGRQTYMPTLVIDYVTRHLRELSARTLKVIDDDLRETWEMQQRSGSDYLFGDPQIDEPGWLRFWNLVKDELELRRKADA